MSKWYREHPLGCVGGDRKEKWICKDSNDNIIDEAEIAITIGKKTDLLALKKRVLSEIKEQIKYFKRTRKELYAVPDYEAVDVCPVCDARVVDSEEKVVIYGAKYSQCKKCSHVYVVNRASKKAIGEFYLSNVNYASTYTDKEMIDFRTNKIAMPWVDWMVKTYKEVHGTLPRRILDVGSGAGHFVKACRKSGLEAEGIELSQPSRKFAKDCLEIDLHGGDFVEDFCKFENVDVVTFWGLLEHTPNPLKIVQTAHELLASKKSALMIAKLPRWDSLSTAIQCIISDSVIRHLDPMGHIMCFTDASAATLFKRGGFSPKAAWYYGMDIYELLMQIGVHTGNLDVLTASGDIIMKLQDYLDHSCYSDSLTLAGVPESPRKG
ncbi:MAG: class I SAM-dependent methyltransferase [Candidatus Scalindua sp.]|jgi:2-polyprenyl-3-methyl-5-hydroxy-6-metoxy-1,4-benzoquinol methylase|nr:class I SAM-dependent methyltransferase [Candidatus Scalindua sp.]